MSFIKIKKEIVRSASIKYQNRRLFRSHPNLLCVPNEKEPSKKRFHFNSL
ncbi:hypothetical protein LEP1GSC077_3008 [Leptospira interrogans str. C10069]|nr:hypothetical protein LEP1GSC077_3008 [Leptospira interrogans str. C10069]